MSEAVLSEIFYDALDYFEEKFVALITTLRTDLIMVRAALYADAISKFGAPLDSSEVHRRDKFEYCPSETKTARHLQWTEKT